MSIHYQNDPLFRFLDVGGACCEEQEAPSVGSRENGCLSGRSLAMVYSPCQEFEGLYDPMAGLARGTVFRELEKPFLGKRRI